MSFPVPDPTNFDQAANAFDLRKPTGTHIDGIAIIQSGVHPVWSVNYTSNGFILPSFNNIPSARREFQHSAPTGTSVGIVSVCTIKPGGLILSKWQVQYIVSVHRHSPTSSEESYGGPPSPPDRHWSDEDYQEDNQRAEQQRLDSAINEATETLRRTHTTTSKRHSKRTSPPDSQTGETSRPRIQPPWSVRFVPASQHRGTPSGESPYKQLTDGDYIKISKGAHKYPTQEHLDARLIHITKSNVAKIPAKLIPLMSKAKRSVYYTMRRLLWKASKLTAPEDEQKVLEREATRLQTIYADMSLKSSFNQIISSHHPSEICAALHHIVNHRTRGKTNHLGNSTMSSICAWSHSIIGPLRFKLDHEFLTKLLNSVNQEFHFTSEQHDIILAAKSTSAHLSSPKECISFRLA